MKLELQDFLISNLLQELLRLDKKILNVVADRLKLIF